MDKNEIELTLKACKILRSAHNLAAHGDQDKSTLGIDARLRLEQQNVEQLRKINSRIVSRQQQIVTVLSLTITGLLAMMYLSSQGQSIFIIAACMISTLIAAGVLVYADKALKSYAAGREPMQSAESAYPLGK